MERLERVLDTAAELLVRHGYGRVTVEDVARAAGVGKGTVYLHVRTKEELFLAVLLRSHRHITTRLADRMEADPAAVLPGPMMRGIYLDLAADPVTRALYLGDEEVLGRLAHEAADVLGELGKRRDAVVTGHLERLRDAGCLRTDLGVAEQRHVLTAVASGFYFVDAQPLGAPDAEARAALLEHALAAALQEPDPPSGALAAVAQDVAREYRGLIEHADHEWRKRVR